VDAFNQSFSGASIAELKALHDGMLKAQKSAGDPYLGGLMAFFGTAFCVMALFSRLDYGVLREALLAAGVILAGFGWMFASQSRKMSSEISELSFRIRKLEGKQREKLNAP
jgi:hypothetical protein